MQTRDQKYAAIAFQQVSEFKERRSENGKVKKAEVTPYGSMAHKLPVLIRSAGLAQALAFLDTRGTETQKDLLKHLEFAVYGKNSNPNQLLERSRDAELGEYMRLTREALAALLWYKRFAQSVLGVDPGDDSEENANNVQE